MKRAPVRWSESLRQIFSPLRKRRPSTRLAVEELADRIVPAVTFDVTLASGAQDGQVGSLRWAINQANASADPDVTIRFTQASTAAVYTIVSPNGAGGQENNNVRGDLDIRNTNPAGGGKTYTFVGATGGSTVAAAFGFEDRLFHVIGNTLTVRFQNVTIGSNAADLQGGFAVDNGTAGAKPFGPNQTDARGGGILNEGGAVSLTNSVLQFNQAVGGDGVDGLDGSQSPLPNTANGAGADGGNGSNGRNAFGGGLYSTAGTITLNGTLVQFNQALGGLGGAGGDGNGISQSSVTGGAGGVGGRGGNAAGGGLYLEAGTLVADAASAVSTNAVNAGSGGSGGSGGVGGGGTISFGEGGRGGAGGAGGEARGGGIFSGNGAVTLTGASVENNQLNAPISELYPMPGTLPVGAGGVGGAGGNAPGVQGFGGFGANGGAGGLAHGAGIFSGGGNVTLGAAAVVGDNVANAGSGGSGGAGGTAGIIAGEAGNGAVGGEARGGGVYLTNGTLLVNGASEITNNDAVGGAGGAGGNGGNGGNTGARGGNGADAGDALGGGAYVANGSITIDASIVADNCATGGAGGAGGAGGGGPFRGFQGGAGGAGGDARGGGLYLGTGTVNVLNESELVLNRATAGAGGAGGAGGNGANENPSIGIGGAGGNGGAGGVAAGGAVYAASGAVNITLSLVQDNEVAGGAGGNGGAGGIGATGGNAGAGGNAGNGGDALGGGIYANGALTLTGVNVDGNLAGGAAANGGAGGAGGTSGEENDGGAGGEGGNGGNSFGGGVFVAAGNAAVAIRNSSFINNVADLGGDGGAGGGEALGGDGGDVAGGGLYTAGNNVLVSNSTFSGNEAGAAGAAGNDGLDGESQGGGVYAAGGTRIANSTVVENTAGDAGGGVYVFSTGNLTLISTIVGQNTLTTGTDGADLATAAAATLTGSNNLIEDATGFTGITNGTNGNQIGVDFLNGSSENIVYGDLDEGTNGTFFHPLVSVTGSPNPALNTGANPDGLTTDQIGNPRVTNGAIDVGAIEAEGTPVPPVPPTPPAFLTSTRDDTPGSGNVRLINADTGAVIQDFRPFASYSRVVNVAMGDVNGDGVSDLILATRGAANGRVRVYDGASAFTPGVDLGDPSTWTNLPGGLTTPLLATITPFNNYKGGLTVASGDVNDDGFDDVIIGSVAGVIARFTAFSGQNLTTRLGASTIAFGQNFTGGVNVTAGNVDGDGSAEVIVGTASIRSRARIFDFDTATTPFTPKAAAFDVLGGNVPGVQVVAVDVTGDGTDEFAVAGLVGGQVNVALFDGTGTQQGTTFTVGTGVTTFGVGEVDLDEDGADDLLVGTNPPTGGNQVSVVDPSNGTVTSGFDAFPTLTGGIALGGF